MIRVVRGYTSPADGKFPEGRGCPLLSERNLLRTGSVSLLSVWGFCRAWAVPPPSDWGPTVLLCVSPSQPGPRTPVLWTAAGCGAGPWGPALDVREKGGHTWTEGKWRGKCVLKQSSGSERGCRATTALRAQDRGPGPGWVIQACPDSVQPHLASPAYLEWEWVAEAGGTGVLLGRR